MHEQFIIIPYVKIVKLWRLANWVSQFHAVVLTSQCKPLLYTFSDFLWKVPSCCVWHWTEKVWVISDLDFIPKNRVFSPHQQWQCFYMVSENFDILTLWGSFIIIWYPSVGSIIHVCKNDIPIGVTWWNVSVLGGWFPLRLGPRENYPTRMSYLFYYTE